MNFRTTLILLVCLLLVGAYVMFTSGPNAPSRTNTSLTKVFDLTSNDINKLTITPADGKRIVLERKTLEGSANAGISPAQSDWKISEPITAYADGMKVSDLLDTLVASTSTAQIPITGNGADYGLDTPQFTVDLEAGAKSVRLDVGRVEKAGNELYVRIEGKDTAQVIAADLLDKLDTTAQKLRLTRMVNVDATTANWISIQRPVDPLTISKVAGNWEISLPGTRPTTLPAEQSVVQDLISAVNNAQATGFADATANASLLIGTPQATVTISAQPPTQPPSTQPVPSATVEFGALDSLVGKNVWARITPPGVLATLPKDTMDAILKGPLDLRDKTVARIDPSDVTEIRIAKNRPLPTQPIALGSITYDIDLVRRPPEKVSVIAGPPVPTTVPTTGPTTLASTQPTTGPFTQAVATTEPVKPPPSVWQMVGSDKPPVDADDTKVDAALAAFSSLRADKYLPTSPTTTGRKTFFVTLTRKSGPPVSITFYDPGATSSEPVLGIDGDAIFDVARTVITPLDVDFGKGGAANPNVPTANP